jgi:hypothetical protein
MSYESFYVDSGKGLHKFGKGIVTSAEIHFSAVHEAIDAERAQKLKYGLVDFSETTDLQMTTESIRHLVEVNRKMADLTPGAFVAVVAPNPQAYGLVRIWQTFTEGLGWKANVFHSRAAAIWWLRKQLGIEDGTGAIEDDYPSLRLEAPPGPDT